MDKVKKNLQRMHEIAQEASAGVRAALSTSAWEPKFEAIAHDQEQLAINFCNEIAQRRLGPVRLIEMAEALYLAERNDPVVGASAAPQASQPIGQPVSAGDAMRWAAKIVQLYDDATMRDDYMIDANDAEKILLALADYVDRFSESNSQPVVSEATVSGAGMTDEQIGMLEYRGNSVAFIRQKMEAYRKSIDRVWDTLRQAGYEPDGITHAADMITRALSASGQAQSEKAVRDAAGFLAEAVLQSDDDLLGCLGNVLGMVAGKIEALNAALRSEQAGSAEQVSEREALASAAGTWTLP